MNVYTVLVFVIMVILFNIYTLSKDNKNTITGIKYVFYRIYKKFLFFKFKNNKHIYGVDLKEKSIINDYIVDQSNYLSMFVIDKFYYYLFLNNNHRKELFKWLNVEVKPMDNIMNILKANKNKLKIEFFDILKENFDRALSGETYGVSQRLRINEQELYYNFEFIPMKNEYDDIDKVFVIMVEVTEYVILQKEIINAKKAAEKLCKEESEVNAYISHEIRTSINSILGLSDILLKKEDNRKKHDYLKIINDSGEYLLSILNDVLDISKLEAGKLILNSELYAFNDIITEIDDIFSSDKKEKDVYIKIKIDEKTPELIIGDSFRLKQILINLLSNAYKYTNKGFLQLNVIVVEKTTTNSGKSYGKFRFEVIDSGVGIPHERIDDIFKKYTQVRENNSKQQVKGTGLGLAISKQLVEAMGGNIIVCSKLNEGTKFSFEIPFEGIEEMEKETMLPLNIDNKDINILIADDNEVNQNIIKSFIDAQGWNSCKVENGKEALEELFRQKYDLILMDFHMPIMNGIEAAKEIKKHVKLKDIPIVALTAGGFEEYRENSRYFSGYISKPTSGKDLNFVLKKQLRFSLSKNKKSEIEYSELNNFIIVEEMVGGNKEIVIDLGEKVIDMFSQQQIYIIRTMIQEKNITELAELIHKLKGAALNFQLTELVKNMDELVENAKVDDKQKIETNLKNISQQIIEFQNELSFYSVQKVRKNV